MHQLKKYTSLNLENHGPWFLIVELMSSSDWFWFTIVESRSITDRSPIVKSGSMTISSVESASINDWHWFLRNKWWQKERRKRWWRWRVKLTTLSWIKKMLQPQRFVDSYLCQNEFSSTIVDMSFLIWNWDSISYSTISLLNKAML